MIYFLGAVAGGYCTYSRLLHVTAEWSELLQARREVSAVAFLALLASVVCATATLVCLKKMFSRRASGRAQLIEMLPSSYQSTHAQLFARPTTFNNYARR
jgi:hypothetical protein